MLLEKINQDMDDNDRSTPSAKLFTGLQGFAVLVIYLILLAELVLILVDESLWLSSFGALFYPTIILFVLTFFCGLAQVFRQRLKRNILFLALAVIAVALVIVGIVYQVTAYGTFYLPPFTFYN